MVFSYPFSLLFFYFPTRYFPFFPFLTFFLFFLLECLFFLSRSLVWLLSCLIIAFFLCIFFCSFSPMIICFLLCHLIFPFFPSSLYFLSWGGYDVSLCSSSYFSFFCFFLLFFFFPSSFPSSYYSRLLLIIIILFLSFSPFLLLFSPPPSFFLPFFTCMSRCQADWEIVYLSSSFPVLSSRFESFPNQIQVCGLQQTRSVCPNHTLLSCCVFTSLVNRVKRSGTLTPQSVLEDLGWKAQRGNSGKL